VFQSVHQSQSLLIHFSTYILFEVNLYLIVSLHLCISTHLHLFMFKSINAKKKSNLKHWAKSDLDIHNTVLVCQTHSQKAKLKVEKNLKNIYKTSMNCILCRDILVWLKRMQKSEIITHVTTSVTESRHCIMGELVGTADTIF
jgi:hypothetical protein